MTDRVLMQAFFDHCDAFLYVKDAEGRFLMVNKGDAAALGLSEADCIGKTAYDFLPKEEADRTCAVDRHVKHDPRPAWGHGGDRV